MIPGRPDHQFVTSTRTVFLAFSILFELEVSRKPIRPTISYDSANPDYRLVRRTQSEWE